MAGPRPGPGPHWLPATALLHRGHGPEHVDLIFDDGPHCPTMRLERSTWSWQPRHRRRYLVRSGPISHSRGYARVLWRGWALILPRGQGWMLRLRHDDQQWSLLLSSQGVVIPVTGPHYRPWALRIRA